MINLNFLKEDILHCSSYYEMVDYHYSSKLDNLPSGIVHVDTQALSEFFTKISSYPNNKYIIVASRSDFGIAKQNEYPSFKDLISWINLMVGPEFNYKDITCEARIKRNQCNINDIYSIRNYYLTSHTFLKIPSNILKIFSTNLYILNDNKLEGLLFGLNCTDNKTEGIEKIYQHKYSGPRDKLLYVNFSLNNFERVRVKSYFKNYCSWATVKEDVKPDEYLDDLSSHMFCLVPAGVGIDSYRVLECLYIGCIPILQLDNPIYYWYQKHNLPVLNVSNFISLNPIELEIIWKKYQDIKNTFNWNALKASYWKDIIESSRKLLYE